MDREPNADPHSALERRVSRLVAGTAEFKAPQDVESAVLARIDRLADVPWWGRRVMDWPRFAQAGFVLAGVATAAALLFGQPTTPSALNAMIAQPGAALRQPVADLHTTLNVLSVFHRATDTVTGALPDGLWYGGLALCAGAYVALFFLVVFGYRLLQAPAASR